MGMMIRKKVSKYRRIFNRMLIVASITWIVRVRAKPRRERGMMILRRRITGWKKIYQKKRTKNKL